MTLENVDELYGKVFVWKKKRLIERSRKVKQVELVPHRKKNTTIIERLIIFRHPT